MSSAPTTSYTICSMISYTISYTISYVFAHHYLRPLKWLARVIHVELFFIAFSLIRTKSTWFNQCIVQQHCSYTWHSCMYRTATHPPSDHPFIWFQGQCCAQTTSCTPWLSIEANLRPHNASVRSRHHSLRGVGSAASAETPFSSPLHGRKRMTCCTQIYTVRLSDTCCGGLHTSLVHWPSAWRAAMAIFFRVGTTGKQYFPALLAWCEAYRMRPQIKRFGPYAHSMGGGPRVIGTAGRRRVKRHTIS